MARDEIRLNPRASIAQMSSCTFRIQQRANVFRHHPVVRRIPPIDLKPRGLVEDFRVELAQMPVEGARRGDPLGPLLRKGGTYPRDTGEHIFAAGVRKLSEQFRGEIARQRRELGPAFRGKVRATRARKSISPSAAMAGKSVTNP